MGLEVTGNCNRFVEGVDRGGAGGFKWTGGGKKTHSVLESLEGCKYASTTQID